MAGGICWTNVAARLFNHRTRRLIPVIFLSTHRQQPHGLQKPQKGNPHQLTVNQHCFPASCIKRFANTDGKVELVRLPKNEQVLAKPDAKIFCAKRAWDQRAEHIFMKEIEDKYKILAEEIIANSSLILDTERQEKITDMFALWNIRIHWKEQPVEDQTIKGAIGVAVEYSKDQQEELEKNGITAIRPDLTLPGRSLTGVSIQTNLYAERERMHDAHWGILRSHSAEFLVPDRSTSSRMIPLSPNLCLFSQSENEDIDENEVAEINARSVADSKEFYFAQVLSQCPK
jgi:hypothetical protein